ncbi:MAG: tyrosine-type recombinase/integrase [Anaerolineales bacterium]|nr:tyrosine-type recombinase/integrase [Anaerolineales bacterium]
MLWTDVDWDNITLRVKRQLQPVNFGGGALAPTKTKISRQQIQLGKGAMLEIHCQRQENDELLASDRWQEHGIIFTTGIGTDINQRKVSQEVKCILRENGLPDIRFHDLCHTSTSRLLDIGTPITTVQSRAGRSKAGITTDIKGHARTHSQDMAAKIIEEIGTPRTNDLQ